MSNDEPISTTVAKVRAKDAHLQEVLKRADRQIAEHRPGEDYYLVSNRAQDVITGRVGSLWARRFPVAPALFDFPFVRLADSIELELDYLLPFLEGNETYWDREGLSSASDFETGAIGRDRNLARTWLVMMKLDSMLAQLDGQFELIMTNITAIEEIDIRERPEQKPWDRGHIERALNSQVNEILAKWRMNRDAIAHATVIWIKQLTARLRIIDRIARTIYPEIPDYDEVTYQMSDQSPEALPKPMSDGELEVWTRLEGKAMTGKELAKSIGTSEDVIRARVSDMRADGHQIQNWRGRGGYFRPDAPPVRQQV